MLLKRILWFTIVVLPLALLSARVRAGGQPAAQVQSPEQISSDKQEPGRRCIYCHRSEVEGYARSSMAHSLRRAGNEPDGSVNLSDGTIAMHSAPDGYWQWLQADGETTNYRVDYVIGSGTHASGYLLDVAGHLFQSPVAYYKSRQAYDLAPGYEGTAHPDFTRPVSEACLFCHSGTALHIAGTSNKYRSPVFAVEAITCDRCHGPAEKHLEDPRAGTIMTPAKLAPAARDSVCEQCHLLGVGRVLNPGKQFEDFRVGEPLEDVFTTYTNALPPGADTEKFKVISHVEQLARSMCSRHSAGKLWCGTCHDPHDKPVEPIAFYRSKCLSCHAGNFAASHPNKESNCIGCHMPRRDAKDGGHTAFTDHRIQRRPAPESPLPADVDIAAWREPAPDFQKRNLGIAYVNVGGERRSPEFIVRGYRMLAEVQDQFSSDSAFFTAIGTALLLGKHPSEAEFAFDRAAELDPQSATAESNAGSAYLQAGDADKAAAHFERAVSIDPLQLAAASPLVDLYTRQGNTAKAEQLSASISAALQSQPASAEQPTQPSGGQPAEKAFKNIQILKDTPAEQLIPAMRFITASLGVECSYCHVQDHFDSDDKKPKKIARDMMRMMFAINQQNFEGSREVTCNSCHRGSPKPEAIPVVGGERPHLETPDGSQTAKLPANLPTVNQILDHYIQALGGAEALDKISSRQQKGTITSEGKSVGAEIFDQQPDKLAVIRHLPAGDAVSVFDGNDGWASAPGHPAREMHGADLDAARLDANLQLALHLKDAFPELRVEYPEKIGDREVFVLVGKKPGKPAVKFYFDEQSGLLMRLVRYAESPVGLDPTQIDYSDYRNVDGVEVPFQWNVQQPGEISTWRMEEVRQNVSIDAARFAKPAKAAGP